jgi:hypothetical protein
MWIDQERNRISERSNPVRPMLPIAVSAVAAVLALAADGGTRVGAQSPPSAVSLPSAPSGLSSSVTGSTITLTWFPAGGSDPATSYVIEAGSSTGATNLANVDTANSSTMFAAASVPAGVYFVRVRAKNSVGVSGPSNEVAVIVGGAAPCNTVPAAPTNLTASVNGGTVTLNWLAAGGGCGANGYTLQAGSSRGANDLANTPVGAVTSFVASNVGVGTYFVRVRGTDSAGASVPSNEVIVTVGAGTGAEPTTFTDGPGVAYLQKGSFRVGIDKNWGGAIREIWFQSSNLVDNHDGGRLIGLAVYDGNDHFGSDGCCTDPNHGWNPAPSDRYDHVNPPLDLSFQGGVLYVRDRHLQWNPDNKGGGPRAAVPSDLIVESWIDLLGSNPGVVHVRYRLTHLGSDEHGTFGQELPFVYVNLPYSNFVRYSGGVPWSNAPVDIGPAPVPPPYVRAAASESWGGLVDSNGVGLVLWAPQSAPQYGYFCSIAGAPFCYMSPFTSLSIGPGFAYQSDVYLFAGRWQDARTNIYTLHQQLQFPDVNPPQGDMNGPQNARISGTVDIAGFALDNSGAIARVEILLDGTTIGRATYGISRPDVQREYPGIPNSGASGFVYHLDTRAFANGTHTIRVRAFDAAGNSDFMVVEGRPGAWQINIQN